MKVDRIRFLKAVAYIKAVNRCPIEELDLSEFTTKDISKNREDFKFTGLANQDFILTGFFKNGWDKP